jgi:hypothetical protein
MRHIGVLTSGAAADDPDGRVRSAAFLRELQQLGPAGYVESIPRENCAN